MSDFGKSITTIADLNPSVSITGLPDNFLVSFIGMADVSEDGFLINKHERPLREVKSGFTRFNEGDVLFAKITPCMENGKGAIAKGLKNKIGFGSTEFHVFRNKQNGDAGFIYQILQSPGLRLKAEARMTGSAGQQRVPSEFFNFYKIFIPASLSEQRKIARILSTADAVIEKTQTAIAKYKAIKQGMLHDLFTRGIDPATNKLRPAYENAPHLYKPSKLGWIPKEWEVENLEESEIEIIDGDRGLNYPKESDLNDSGYCLFLSATNVTKDGFKFETKQFISKEKDEILGTGKLRREDIIVTTRGTVGNVAFYEKSVPYSHIRINSGMIILRNTGSKIQVEFLFHYLKDYLFKILYQKSLSGSAQPQLPIKDLKKFFIVYSSEKEQEGLSTRVQNINNKIQTEQAYLHKLQQIKAGLMADLLSGKKKVNVKE